MSLKQMMQTLPMNRKEVFFTATVLPGIICCNDCAHFSLFLKTIGLDDISIDISPGAENIQFYTEYSIIEALAPREIKEMFAPASFTTKETPDLIIRIDVDKKTKIIAIEGKMFSSVRPRRLKSQMDDQHRKVLGYLANHLTPDIIHIALLPKQMIKLWEESTPLASELASLKTSVRLVTWEQIVAPFKDKGLAQYWVSILEIALQDFSRLAAKAKWRSNNDAIFRGEEIMRRYGSEDFPYEMMGRRGGLDGKKLTAEIESGDWKKKNYEVKKSTERRPRWFPIEDFIKRIEPART